MASAKAKRPLPPLPRHPMLLCVLFLATRFYACEGSPGAKLLSLRTAYLCHPAIVDPLCSSTLFAGPRHHHARLLILGFLANQLLLLLIPIFGSLFVPPLFGLSFGSVLYHIASSSASVPSFETQSCCRSVIWPSRR